MNSFNEFRKGTCILLDLLFLKHTKKEKNGKKKKLDIYQTSFQLSSPPADNLSPSTPAQSS